VFIFDLGALALDYHKRADFGLKFSWEKDVGWETQNKREE
jgi:hypothetical protein